MKFRISIAFVLLLLAYLSTGWRHSSSAANSASISGTVIDANGPISGASVRIRATENQVYSDANGDFNLGGLNFGEQVEVTAWADGYYVASLQVVPPASNVILTIRRYHTSDNPDYQWISPEPNSSDKACGNCHPMILPQWETNAHGGAISNPRFFSMYNGTNISGYNKVAPGYIDDFPGTAGNCASCHAPGAAVDGYLTTNMNSVRNVITDGIHCDYCHKVGGVYLDPSNGTVHSNSPGVNSQKILRPPTGDNIFLGPFDDIPDPDTYLPQISESQFCAPCHQFSFWGTPIYESFNEWLESPYAAEGITCQKCHMLPNGDTLFALPEVGGITHPPESIPSHLQVGAGNVELLQNSVELSTDVVQSGGRIDVSVQVTNTNVGHHVPTDHPGRHLILTVNILDEHDQPLTQLLGPRVPTWGGEQAGMAGKTYAKILQDTASGKYPVVSYWKRTRLVSDNRIPAGESDSSNYTFLAPPGGETIRLIVELRFRRLFDEIQSAKGWETPDVIMEQASQSMVVSPWWVYYLPLASSH
ncbi:MAG: carboxypeptidase regulatory-like domain-containing protein [Anaerolineales bacterium]